MDRVDSMLAPRPSLKRRIFLASQRTLGASGIGELYASCRRSNVAIILMYHSVCRPEVAPWVAPRNRMSIEMFERQLQRLAGTGRVVSLSRLADAAAGGEPLAPGSMVLTFDDGYLDNLEVVAPLLARYDLPAVLYLATGYVRDAAPQWADMVYSAVYQRTCDTLEIEGIGRFDLAREGHREAAIYQIGRRMIESSRADRESFLRDLRTQTGAPDCPVKLTMDFDDVRRMAREFPSFELGVHTADHLDMSSLSTDDALREIRRSMDDFKSELGRDAEHFSFPYSRSTPEVIAGLGSLGLKTAMTGEGVVPLDRIEPFNMLRLESPLSMSLFRYWTSGAHPSLTRTLLRRS